MFTIIFSVTDENEMFGLIPKSGKVWKSILSPDDANFYRRKLAEEIMIRIYFNVIPGDIIGRYILLDPFSLKTNIQFYFESI